MSKKDFLKTLTKEQRDFVEFLLDTAYANGYQAGQFDMNAVNYYNNW